MGEVLVRSHVLVFEAAEQRDHRLEVSSGVAERPEVLEGELEEVVAQEDHLLGSCEHAEVRGEPELERVFLDQPVAEGVKGRDLDVGIAVGHELVHALFHLGRGLVREGEGEDLGGAGLPGRDEVGDAAGDHRGLARARSRDDEQRAGEMSHCFALGPREAVEYRVRAARSLRHQNLKAK